MEGRREEYTDAREGHAETAIGPIKSTKIGMCGICRMGCGVNVHMEDGKIERLTPLKGHPLAYVCPRGEKSKGVVYSPDRLLYPQKRVGERGEGRFERISWDEAFDIMVDNLRKTAKTHGPEATCIYSGTGNFEHALIENFAPQGPVETEGNAVLFPFGSPNASGAGSLCYVSYALIAPEVTFGASIRNMNEDIENSELVLVWGVNPVTNSPPAKLTRLKKAKANGARIVTIDFRNSETARHLNSEWIGIRPGTDGALALGMMNVLIKEDLYDHDFVETWTHGFDDLAAYVRDFTPQKVEAITGVPAQTIRELARAMAEAKGCSIFTYTGLEYSNSGVQSIRGVWMLQVLCGHIDCPGGKLFRMRDRPHATRIETPAPANAPTAIGAEQFPIYHAIRNEAHAMALPRAILEGDPYPVRAMIVGGASLITCMPDPDLWRRTLAALDFLAVINRVPTNDAQYADLVLPATTGYEIQSYICYEGHIQLRDRIIEPLGEARNDYLIYAELAQRLGYGHLWPQTEDALVEHALQGTGVTLDELRAHPEGIPLKIPKMRYRKYETGDLRADGKPGFETPSGKCEISSELLRRHGYDPLPVYTEPLEGPIASPEVAERYPLVLNTGTRIQATFRTQQIGVPSLMKRQPRPHVYLHTRDAEARNIAGGDPVDVVSPRGRVPYWASVGEDIVEGSVDVNMGGGGPVGPKAWRDANVNELTDMTNLDPISGFPVYKALLCEVEKREVKKGKKS